jgi:squalene-hopene/tetraprenyl-beta-curcumene cyclase
MVFKQSLFMSIFLLIFFLLTQSIASKTIPIKTQTNDRTNINLSLQKETDHSLGIAQSFLLNAQSSNGSWKDHPAITALVLYSFMLPPSSIVDRQSEQAIQKGLTYIESFVQKDGGIYRKEYRTYVTSVCLLALVETNAIKYQSIISNAKQFLIRFQLDEDENISKDNPYYGGIGYGGDDRPDLSNTQLALEAIHAAEAYESRLKNVIPQTVSKIEADEKQFGLHWKKALVFLARCQNVKAVNKMPYATDDGGFIYETGTYKKERSHSYGSMTYAGVKSLIYANIDKSDVRIQKAVQWIQDNYTVEKNPGFDNTSLFYYYMTF